MPQIDCESKEVSTRLSITMKNKIFPYTVGTSILGGNIGHKKKIKHEGRRRHESYAQASDSV